MACLVLDKFLNPIQCLAGCVWFFRTWWWLLNGTLQHLSRNRDAMGENPLAPGTSDQIYGLLMPNSIIIQALDCRDSREHETEFNIQANTIQSDGDDTRFAIRVSFSK